ncbi:ABC transporter G family member [Beauveria bassiana]|uniref:ABC transporter G family member n=1 Tax=Beauveria bassiana TaxID=176275 RepID=A0A2N6NTU8_BEABA|nr:ABC transporter G family member [Beauveria bassiana]
MKSLGSMLFGIAAALPAIAAARQNASYPTVDMLRAQLALMGDNDRPDGCPPCFNCLLPAHTCTQYAGCNEFNGICDCPAGFGGDDCLKPRASTSMDHSDD